MPTIIYPSPIFGPVKSRRLGISLGVNLLPKDGKICTFDCIYCECGFNDDRRPKERIPSHEEVAVLLEKKLAQMRNENTLPDVITFAGNGEPTIHPQFSDIIDSTIALRDKYCPKAKVSVLSNATMIVKPSVFDALMKVDNNILKLDTVDINYIRRVDRPAGKYDLEQIIKTMKTFKGKCVIQTMFLKGTLDGVSLDNTGDEFVKPWIDTVKEIAPREVMIYTIDRETPYKNLEKATHDELDRIVRMLAEEGVKATASY